jgi:hypothetical protein
MAMQTALWERHGKIVSAASVARAFGMGGCM